MSEHLTHVYGDWVRVNESGWERTCQVEGCTWRQGTSDDPSLPQTPWGRATSRLVGIDLDASVSAPGETRGEGET